MGKINRVVFQGNLTREVELRATPGGASVVSFGVANNRKWKDKKSGEMREEATFIDVEAWGYTADFCHQYLGKGSHIILEGRLQCDSWDDKETGKKRSKLKVVAENVQFAGPKVNASDPVKGEDGEIPF